MGVGCTPFALHQICFIGAKVVSGSLNLEQRFAAAKELRGSGGKGRGVNERKGRGLRRFLSNNSPILPGNFASRLVPSSRTGSLAWVRAVILFFFSFSFLFFFFFPACLVTTAWEQADRSRIALCQYRLQESISSQTGSEIGGGSYRFLRWFLVSFSELVWFRLVRYYFELGWDKHIPLVHQMLTTASQFPEAPGLTFLGARECPGKGEEWGNRKLQGRK